MSTEALYYCPICLMDTRFRVLGEGSRATYVCSECCVEFTQEPGPPTSDPHRGSGDRDVAQSDSGNEETLASDLPEDPVEEDPSSAHDRSQDEGRPTLRRIPTISMEEVARSVPPVPEVPAEEEVLDLEKPPEVVDPVPAIPLSERLVRDSQPEVTEKTPERHAASVETPVDENIERAPARPPSIGVLGPTSGGKSIFIARLIDRLSRAPIDLGDEVKLFTTPYQDIHSWTAMEQEILSYLREGKWPANTPRPQSRTIDIRLRGSETSSTDRNDFCLRFLDCAGETLLSWLKNQRKKKMDPQFDPIFESEEMSRTHANIDGVMRGSRGLLLLVSPEHSPLIGGGESVEGAEDFPGHFFQYLFDFQSEMRVKYDIAIAFTKYDRFRSLIDRENVEEFVRRYFARMHSTLQGFFDGQYQYFTISSVGHIYEPLGLDGKPLLEEGESRPKEDGRPAPHAVPFGVEAPILWLLRRLREHGELDGPAGTFAQQ